MEELSKVGRHCAPPALEGRGGVGACGYKKGESAEGSRRVPHAVDSVARV